jgi:hypothetical protein
MPFLPAPEESDRQLLNGSNFCSQVCCVLTHCSVACSRLNRLDNVQAAIDLILGTGLMAMRSILAGQTPPDYPEQITKLVLKTLGVADMEAEAIAFNLRWSACMGVVMQRSPL